jgi:monofunctional biosynthetic peptidoglycan transglycosylase
MARNFPFLLDFSAPGSVRPRPVNDVVMGGRSMSRFRVADGDVGVFEGRVSLANGGGFASVRAGMEQVDLSGASGVTLRVRGDGKRYRLILRNDRALSGVNWQQSFTAPEAWTELHLLFSDFEPSLRGRRPSNPPPFNPGQIRQVGFMIADRQEGPFQLEVAWIRGWDGR